MWKGHVIRQVVCDSRGHSDILRESAHATELRGWKPDHLAVVAEVDLTRRQEKHLPQNTVESKVTQLPGLKPEPALPTASTDPSAS